MRRFGRSMLAFVLVLTALVMPGAVEAQGELSQGCAFVDSFGGMFASIRTGYDLYAAGDHLTFVASEPVNGVAPTSIQLEINGQVVDQDGFPGTVEYIMPVDGFATLRAATNGSGATWDVTCESGPPPTPTCNGQTATIYVKDGVIVGGPNDGAAYTGTLAGTSGSDVIVGTDGRDSIDGRAGNDTICGLGGNDTIEGAAGNDTMLGGSGGDKLNGASGTDTTPDFNRNEGDKRTNVP